MKTKITYRDLVEMIPCYYPEEIGIKRYYSATIPKFIAEYRYKVKNKEDIIWVLCREEYMTDRNMRLFAVWCAREALKLITDPDPRSINACDIAEKFANGEASKEELTTAWNAARAAARVAAGAAAWVAAGAAAWAAADAAGAAADAAWAAADAAGAAARDAQINQLLIYFK